MELADLIETAEMAAWADMVRAAPAPVADGLGLDARPLAGGLALIARRLDAAEFNRVMGVGLARTATREDLAEIAATYRPLNLTKARLQLAPQAEPRAQLDGWLAEQGFSRAPLDWVKMARETAGPPDISTDLVVVEAGPAEAEAFGAIVCAGYGMPPVLTPWLAALVGRPDWRCYLAMDGEAPVAGAALHLGATHGWLGVAATAPGARRRGGQGALMSRRIADAGRAGKAWALTETGAPVPGEPSPSHDNMVRCGFRLVHRRSNWTI